MTEYEKCKRLRQLILNRAAEVTVYTSWTNDFSVKQIREISTVALKQVGAVDITKLTRHQMISLGFGKWEKGNPLLLIPLWLYPFLPEEIETETINGGTCLKKVDMDTDHRYGCLAYGIR